MLTGKSILITGATGSFGNAFCRHVLECYEPRRLIVFSRDEVKQAEMRARLDHPAMRFFIGDVRDRDRLRRAFTDVDVVIHAAALKRIEVGAYNPAEMVKTNINGAMNVIEAATDAGVGKVIALSTDKAVEPISPYGQSKALAESLFLTANNTRGNSGPHFAVTRYGNVAGSRGSVIPTWRHILRQSDTVPVSDPEVTRFWMTLDQAVRLVIETIITMPGEPAIPVLPAYRLGDLAEAMRAKMKIVGLGAFEKMHEKMRADLCSDTARRMSVPELREALKAA